MPNTRITFRCPADLLALLPTDPGERSRLILEALREHVRPASPEQELAELKRVVQGLQERLGK